MKRKIDFQQQMDRIFSSQQPIQDRMAEGFHAILALHLEESDRQMELLQAIGDRESLVKEQIKHSTMQHVMKILDDCYFRATGQIWQPVPDFSQEAGDE